MLNQKISSAASAANPILRIAGITKSYGPKVVADNLQLAIHKGEFLTFLGASGSGKSTTLRVSWQAWKGRIAVRSGFPDELLTMCRPGNEILE
jgi:ABC-type transporter Mla maintaining outer membrane lipid asymmetry ATPase subunit MlaF